MKRLLLILLLIGWATSSYSAPYLVCDPQAGVKSYIIAGPQLVGSYLAQADGSMKVDLAQVPVGSYDIQVQACSDDLGWGCSAAVPFHLVRPSPSTAPANLRLSR